MQRALSAHNKYLRTPIALQQNASTEESLNDLSRRNKQSMGQNHIYGTSEKTKTAVSKGEW